MSITRLEPTRQFVDRMVLLNRFHAPDEDDYDGARSSLAALHGGFPSGPIHEQAAYIVAGVVRHRPFAEANFRTGWDYTSDMLSHRGYDLQATLAEAQDLGNRAWDLAEDDGLQEDLASWFRPRIHKMARAQP